MWTHADMRSCCRVCTLIMIWLFAVRERESCGYGRLSEWEHRGLEATYIALWIVPHMACSFLYRMTSWLAQRPIISDPLLQMARWAGQTDRLVHKQKMCMAVNLWEVNRLCQHGWGKTTYLLSQGNTLRGSGDKTFLPTGFLMASLTCAHLLWMLNLWQAPAHDWPQWPRKALLSFPCTSIHLSQLCLECFVFMI